MRSFRISTLTAIVVASITISLSIPAQTALSGNVYDGQGGPLLAGQVYTTVGFTVPAGQTLTVQPGAVVKLDNNAALYVYGSLVGAGTLSQRIHFTSIHDDSVGGDTNGNGAATSPGPGSWQRIHFGPNSDASSLQHTVVRFAGAYNYEALNLDQSNASFTNLEIGACAAVALRLGGTSLPTLTSVSISNCGGRAIAEVPWAALAGFNGTSASGCAGGNSAFMVGDVVTDLALTTSNLVGGAVVTDSFTVTAGHTLTLGPGCAVKFTSNAALYVYGVLLAAGTAPAPVVFTSSLDDGIGGDSNGDGIATAPVPGIWQRVYFGPGADASTLQSFELRFAGAYSYPAIDLDQADITMIDCLVHDCHADALNLGGTSAPVVTTSTFAACGGVAINAAPWRALAGFSQNVATGSGLDQVRVVGNVDLNLAVTPARVLNNVVVPVGNFSVLAGSTLTIAADTAVKMNDNAAIAVDGTLNLLGQTGHPALVTSIHDDAAFGDTNKNGAGSVPSPGNWQRIVFNSASDASRLERFEVRYAGSYAYPALDLIQADIEVKDGRVRWCHAAAFHLHATSRPEIERVAIENCGQCIEDAPWAALPGFKNLTANGCGTNRLAVAGDVGEDVTIAAFNLIGKTLVPYGNFSIQPNATLTLLPGVVTKLYGNVLVAANGSLVCRGTGFEPVVFTAIADDQFGGDTEANGPTSVAPGAWQRIVFQGAGSSNLKNVLVRYAGSYSYPAVDVIASGTVLDSVRTDFCYGTGISLGASGVDATNCVAFACGTGFALLQPGCDLVHATAAASGVGIARTPGTAPNYVTASIAFANGLDYSGFVPGQVSYSCGGASIPTGTGNVYQDPLFVDLAGGDVRLLEASPCVDASDQAIAAVLVFDGRDASRSLDGDLDGDDLPDMGAYERAAFALTYTGQPRVGTTMVFSAGGAGGPVIFVGGVMDGYEPVSDYGYLAVGLVQTSIVLAVSYDGSPYQLTLPPIQALDGFNFGVQALGVLAANTTIGNFTERYVGRILGD